MKKRLRKADRRRQREQREREHQFFIDIKTQNHVKCPHCEEEHLEIGRDCYGRPCGANCKCGFYFRADYTDPFERQ